MYVIATKDINPTYCPVKGWTATTAIDLLETYEDENTLFTRIEFLSSVFNSIMVF